MYYFVTEGSIFYTSVLGFLASSKYFRMEGQIWDAHVSKHNSGGKL